MTVLITNQASRLLPQLSSLSPNAFAYRIFPSSNSIRNNFVWYYSSWLRHQTMKVWKITIFTYETLNLHITRNIAEKTFVKQLKKKKSATESTVRTAECVLTTW